MEYGMLPSTGTVGDSRDNAMAESADGAYRTGLVWRRKPFHDPKDLGPATFRRVSRRGPEASAPALGPPDTGTDRNRVLRKPNGASRPTIRAEKKQAISPAPRQTATLPRYGQNNDGRANLAGGQHAHRQSALMSPHRRHQDCGSRISVVKAPSSKLRLR